MLDKVKVNDKLRLDFDAPANLQYFNVELDVSMIDFEGCGGPFNTNSNNVGKSWFATEGSYIQLYITHTIADTHFLHFIQLLNSSLHLRTLTTATVISTAKRLQVH